MGWIKVFDSDWRTLPGRKIIEKYGFYGYGIYEAMKQEVARLNGLVTVEELEKLFCCANFSKAKVKDIIYTDSIFWVDEHNLVHYVEDVDKKVADTRTATPVATHTATPVATPVATHAATPVATPTVKDSNAPAYNKTRKEEKRIEGSPSVPQGEEDHPGLSDPCFDPYRQESWFPRVEYLLAESNKPWRDPTIAHSGFRDLMKKYWKESVLYYIELLVAGRETDRWLRDDSAASSHFGKIMNTGTGDGRELKYRLEALEKEQGTPTFRPPAPLLTKQELYRQLAKSLHIDLEREVTLSDCMGRYGITPETQNPQVLERAQNAWEKLNVAERQLAVLRALTSGTEDIDQYLSNQKFLTCRKDRQFVELYKMNLYEYGKH